VAKTDNTVQLHSHAAATLRYIRSSMEGAASLAVPGSAGIALGLLGVMAAVLSSMPHLHDYWIEIWLTASGAGAVVGGVLLVRKSSLRGLKLIGTPIRHFALCLVPSLAAGVILTGVLWWNGVLHAIPGMWLLLYGCALISSSSVTTRTIGTLGALFCLLGLVAFALPQQLQIVLLGFGFGGLHIAFGILIGRVGHGAQI
jgi:hypothetical protein